MSKQPKAKSSVIYRGPSLIDGKPIIVVAIIASANRKTGSMVQTYIMPDGISPLNASKSGGDYSVCGNCKHRGKPTDDPAKKQAVERSCYVNLGQGPTIVFKGLQRGIYPEACDSKARANIGAGRMVRLGTWGDPAAVPLHVWHDLIGESIGHTGYTHNAQFQREITNLCMVSADSEIDTISAHNKGLRSFRVIPLIDASKPLLKHEILCPSIKGVQCVECKLCNGKQSKAKSIAILAHGIGAKYA